MGRFTYKIAGAFGRAVSWEVGKAMRKKQRRSISSVLTPTAHLPPEVEHIPVSEEERKWIKSIDVLDRRVKELKMKRSKTAAREIYLLLCGVGSVHSQNEKFFSGTLHSQDFMACYKKLAVLSQEMADFTGVHLSQNDINELVSETADKVQVNLETWKLTIS